VTSVDSAPLDWQVYVVQCGDGSLYTGITRQVVERVAAHNKGTGAKYTRSRLPVTLVYSEPASDRSAASQREYQIKQLSRPAKFKLIGLTAA
jgi:predicted GIY-YIG superfamily endonuclease